MSLKNLFFLGMIFWIHGLSAQKDSRHPALPKSGREMQDLIPDGWQVLSQAMGDLNGDGYEDMAFAIESDQKETHEFNGGTESYTLELNPRILGVYFGKRNGKFKKALQSNTFIINRNIPAMDEPFKGIQILPNGDLQIDFYIWPCRDCTSWSSHEYRLRYQNKAFELIGYSESISGRVSGDEIDYVIDFQKGTLKIKTTIINEEDEREYEEELKTFELQQLPSIKSLKKPFEWEFQELHI